ncbi:MAG TPA: hypothetical protein VK671_02325 [Mucilaginibacter sp.]|nr:hypothetical protein [Mucilaginibacter sp.]HXB29842.1 hypothetical protein [Puia sp.]
MIFNKFRPISFCNKLKAFSFQLLALSLFSCNKSANINANKSFVGLTHVAYGVGPVSMTIDGTLLYSNPLAFGLTTGVDGNPYDTTISRISDMNIFLAQDTSMNIHGNAAFQQGGHYSIFFFDTLNSNSTTLIILQDNPPVRYDTFTTIRFMNFSPGSYIGLKLIYKNDYLIDTFHISVRDTIITGITPFIGYNPNPGLYTFSQLVHIGTNQIFAFTDSSNPRIDSLNPSLDSTNFIRLDSLQFDSTKSYNVYLQGFLDSPNSQQNKLMIKSVRVN